MSKPRLGATVMRDGRVGIAVWAPHARTVRAELRTGDEVSVLSLVGRGDGYFCGDTDAVKIGDTYRIALDDGPWLPDPASRSMPEGVHGPTEIVDPSFAWTDDSWPGVAQTALVIYEMHVGTFTDEGTFDAAISYLDELVDLGVTAVELLPTAEVPGREERRNWGYDGVQLYAVRRDFGGIPGLRRFVDASHARGIAVILDVVYNHLGPEGNYLHSFGPYHTDRYRVPWGQALNFDGPYSDDVRHYFLMQALECLEEHHIDGLRLDSTPNIFDRSARPFLAELALQVRSLSERLGRPIHLIAEADDNSPHWVRSVETGGLGLNASWADDLHHALHARFTGERQGFYQDFGTVQDVARAFIHGAVLDGGYAQYRKQRWGGDLRGVPPECLVSFLQNHDRVGNRADGARFASLVEPAAHRAALAISLLSPNLPMLFMGQEYGEKRPFYFFSSFDDQRVIQGLKKGRAEGFKENGGKDMPPDPQLATTRLDSKLLRRYDAEAEAIRQLHRDALALRARLVASGRPQLAEISEEHGMFGCWWPSGHWMYAFLSGTEAGGGMTSSGRPVVLDTDRYAEGTDTSEAVDRPRVVVYGPVLEGDG